MGKKNPDIIIVIIGLVALLLGIFAYIFIGPNYLNKKSINLGIINDKYEIYQFLIDVKSAYCGFDELTNYQNNLNDEMKKDINNKKIKNNQSYYSNIRLLAKKVLIKDTSLGLNNVITNLTVKYSDYSFPKTIHLINLMYENYIKSIENLSLVEDEFDTYAENYQALRGSSKDAFQQLSNTLNEEYKNIRGDDEKLWPNEEKELLNLKTICQIING